MFLSVLVSHVENYKFLLEQNGLNSSQVRSSKIYLLSLEYNVC